MADDVTGDAQPQQVGVDAFQLGDDDADILTTLGHLHAGDILHAHGIGHGMGVGADAADTFHQNIGLDEVAFLGQLFDAAVVVTDEHLGISDHFAVYRKTGMDRLFQRRMVRSDRNGIAHVLNLLNTACSPASLTGKQASCLPFLSRVLYEYSIALPV